MQNYVSAKTKYLNLPVYYRIMDNLRQILKEEKGLDPLDPFSTMDLTFLKRRLPSKNYQIWEELCKN